MKKTALRLIACAGLVVGLVLPRYATATDMWDFLQMTCNPGFNYFSVRTFLIDRNLEIPEQQAIKSAETDSGMYLPQSLLKNPYTCKLPDRSVSVEVSDISPVKETGMCGLAPSFSVTIKINGKEAYRFRANRCIDQAVHLTELHGHNFIRDCTMPVGLSGPEPRVPLSCERIRIKQQP